MAIRRAAQADAPAEPIHDDLDEPFEHPADAPVYDKRGNVRPRGTEGARPMSYDERVEIAQALGTGN